MDIGNSKNYLGIRQICLNVPDRSGVRKVSGLLRIPVYGSTIQLTHRVSSPKSRSVYTHFLFIGVQYVKKYLDNVSQYWR